MLLTAYSVPSEAWRMQESYETETGNQAKTMGKIDIQVNGHTMTATLADNSSAAALVELLKHGPLTYRAHDYGGFEKVGNIGHTLPRNDEYILIVPGDIILYQGTDICIYYDTNEWNFTRLGRIDNLSQSEIKRILGVGECTVTITLGGSSSVSQVDNGDMPGTAGAVYGLDGKALGKAPGRGVYIENGIKKSRL
ncbi:MAG: hypothetical protein K2H16_04595 [Prevotella sp.]|nr:hypothetical protein [Prevotella sp.]